MNKPKITKTPWTYTAQKGEPGSCMRAQVFGGDEDETSVAVMNATDNPEEASANAQLMALAPEMRNALLKSLISLKSARKILDEDYGKGFDALYENIEQVEAVLKKAGDHG